MSENSKSLQQTKHTEPEENMPVANNHIKRKRYYYDLEYNADTKSPTQKS